MDHESDVEEHLEPELLRFIAGLARADAAADFAEAAERHRATATAAHTVRALPAIGVVSSLEAHPKLRRTADD